MGGKGRKRREKNYRAAHGGKNGLPPPPVPSSVNALPSKLRKLMSFTNPSHTTESAKGSMDSAQKNRGEGGSHGVDKKFRSDDALDLKTTGVKKEVNDGIQQHMDHGDEIEKDSTHEKRKKKRKRKPIDDLRFVAAGELGGVGLKRKERKKKRLEAMKKKHKKVKTEENNDFPGHEVIKFGEVVQGPPKLATVPKASKSSHDASKERIRLQAVEAYRNRRGWTSRPGLHLPSPAITSPLL